MYISNIKTPKDLGVALKRMRKHQKLSQSDLAKIAGVRQPTVSDIESGRGTLETFFKIVQAMQTQLHMGESGNKKANASITNLMNILED